MKNEQDFKIALTGKKIPILVLDQKWHRLFAIHGKTAEIKELEANLNSLLARQGKLNNDLKDLKRLKNNLMDGIVENMDGGEMELDAETRKKTMEENKRLIDDINERMDACEDELLEIPGKIQFANEELMLASMEYFYAKLRVNKQEAQEIDEWITQVRIDLKKNIIRKQNREINNKEMYSYLHDIFGAEILNIFDIQDEKQEIEDKA